MLPSYVDEKRSSPTVSFTGDGVATEWRPRLVVGADGRNSQVRRQLDLKVFPDAPRILIGGMLVEAYGLAARLASHRHRGSRAFPDISARRRRVRLDLCYDFADKAPYVGPQRKENMIAAFAGLTCLPYANDIAKARSIGPFNSYSNEDHWTEDPGPPRSGVDRRCSGPQRSHHRPRTFDCPAGRSLSQRDHLAGERKQESLEPYVQGTPRRIGGPRGAGRTRRRRRPTCNRP